MSNLFFIVLILTLAITNGFVPTRSLMNNFKSPAIKAKSNRDISMLFNVGGKSSSSTSSGSVPSNKKLCVITGTTSGLGKSTVKALLENGGYYVVCAVRDVEKMNKVIEEEGFDKKSLAVLKLDLGSFDDTKKFVGRLNSLKKSRPLDVLVCNAAVYQPAFDRVSIRNFPVSFYIIL